MRDFFIFGAGAVLTALAVKYADLPWLWDGTIYVGVAIMAIAAMDAANRRLAAVGHTRMYATIGIIISGICFLGFVGLYFAPGVWSERASSNALNRTIQLECAAATLPETVPANGWHDFVLNDGGVVGNSYIALSPGATLNVGGPSHPPFVNRCRFVNFGPNPVINLEARLELVFRDTVPSGGGLESGKAVKTVTMSVPRISLGTGAQNSFEFYVRNAATRLFVEVKLPKTVRVQAVGKTDWQNVELIPSEYGNFILGPYI